MSMNLFNLRLNASTPKAIIARYASSRSSVRPYSVDNVPSYWSVVRAGDALLGHRLLS